jgi:mono/diheme cytochrome c family protein
MAVSERARGKETRETALAALAAGAFFLGGFTLCLDAHDRITTRVTWDREIAPIFDARCIDCHRPGGRSTIALATYQQARPWAVAIKEEVLTRRMPKWNAARGFGDFANDPSLAPFEIALIAAWVDGGAPESDRNKVTAAAIATGSKPTVFTPPSESSIRTLSAGCGEQRASGRLLAIRPTLAKNGSVGVAAVFPNGQQQIIAWIRNYDPDDAMTYWLRNPVVLPAGSRLHMESAGTCAIDLTFAR